MSGNLYRLSKRTWAVKLDNDVDTTAFPTIEAAADYLEANGVKDEAIDHAIVSMEAYGHKRANFGVHGEFIFSDDQVPNDIIGVA